MTPAIVRSRLEPLVSPDGSLQWKLQRNCAMTPVQLLTGLWFIMLPSMLVGVAFLYHGIPWASVFSGIEVVVLAIAFVCYARNAADAEWVRISGDHVEVQVRSGSVLIQENFHRSFLRMRLCKDRGKLLTFEQSGRSISVGHTIPIHLREDLYLALRSACVPVSRV